MGYEWLSHALAALGGIEPHEVMQALHGTRRLPVPATAESGARLLGIWSRTAAGKPLIVFLRHDGGLDWLIVGAREMKPDELATFEGWEARG